MAVIRYIESAALNEAVQAAYKKGLIVIAAAGNDHVSSKIYPASYDHVVSVASTNSDDHISSFSNYGDSIDISAPGMDILSTLPNGYGYMSGTSMAAPVVSGVAALIWSYHPTFTNQQVINNLYQSADDLGSYGKDPVFGWGRVDAARSLEMQLLDNPFINPVSDRDTAISGKLPETMRSGQIFISNKQGLVAKTSVQNQSTFSMPIPRQQAGASLSVQLQDSANNRSIPVTVTVLDRTPPAIPKTSEITDSTSVVRGWGEPMSKVSVWAGAKKVAETTVDSKGNFSLRISLQKAGTVLSIVSSDRSGNSSTPIKIAVKDKTAPVTPKVFSISNLDAQIRGIAEANSQILIKNGSRLIGRGYAGRNQQFLVRIPRQKEYSRISVQSTDSANNFSHLAFLTVLDKIPPKKPIVYPITYRSTNAAGKADAYSRVVVKSGRTVLGTGKVSYKGYYNIKIKRQKIKSVIHIYIYDASGNMNYASTKVRWR